MAMRRQDRAGRHHLESDRASCVMCAHYGIVMILSVFQTDRLSVDLALSLAAQNIEEVRGSFDIGRQ